MLQTQFPKYIRIEQETPQVSDWQMADVVGKNAVALMRTAVWLLHWHSHTRRMCMVCARLANHVY